MAHPRHPARRFISFLIMAATALAAAACDVAPATTTASSAPVCAPADALIDLDGAQLAVTLTGSPAADELADQLPVAITMRDPMGQSLSGSWPGEPLEVDDADLVTDPEPGGLYYAPDSDTLALYYDDLTDVPAPGWVLIGTLASAATQQLAQASTRADVHIESGAAGCRN